MSDILCLGVRSVGGHRAGGGAGGHRGGAKGHRAALTPRGSCRRRSNCASLRDRVASFPFSSVEPFSCGTLLWQPWPPCTHHCTAHLG